MERNYSIEFFPPRDGADIDRWRSAWQELQAMQPKFYSMTYGAGGSTRDRTLERVAELHQSGAATAPHISCVGSSKADIGSLLQHYLELGIRRLVAIRGDLPSGARNYGDFKYAQDLVSFIRQETGDHFHIEVAAYPEKHPQAQSCAADLDNLKAKFDAGANSAITQYFFNADAYADFIDRCQAKGITAPIVPGIMPITNYKGLARFSDNCGAEIPRWIRCRLEDMSDDPQAISEFGLDVITRLCQQLLDGGAPGLHFYSMNRAQPTLSIWQQLKLPQ